MARQVSPWKLVFAAVLGGVTGALIFLASKREETDLQTEVNHD